MRFLFSSTNNVIGTEWSTLGDFTVADLLGPGASQEPSFDVINVEVENVGDTNAISDFKVQLKDHPDGEWYDYIVATDFDTAGHPNIPFVTAAGPHEVAAESKAHLIARIHGAYAFRFQAKVASSTTTASVRGYGRGQ